MNYISDNYLCLINTTYMPQMRKRNTPSPTLALESACTGFLAMLISPPPHPLCLKISEKRPDNDLSYSNAINNVHQSRSKETQVGFNFSKETGLNTWLFFVVMTMSTLHLSTEGSHLSALICRLVKSHAFGTTLVHLYAISHSHAFIS